MKRTFLVVLVLVLASLAASATYKIQLVDGKTITADSAPIVKEGLAYFTKNGLYFYIPASQIDQTATERLNQAAEPAQAPAGTEAVAVAPAGKAPTVIDEEQLEIIRKRSHLANEGQLEAPVAVEGAPAGTPGGPAAGGGGNADALRAKLADLLSQRGSLMQQQTNLQNQLSQLRDKYNFSTQQSEQASIQSQMDSLQSQLDQVQQQINAVNNEALAAQQDLASQSRTVVVQQPAPEPPPQPAPEGPAGPDK